MESYELLKTIARSLLEDPNIYKGVVKSIPSDYNFHLEDETVTMGDIAYLWLLEQLEEMKDKFKKERTIHA